MRSMTTTILNVLEFALIVVFGFLSVYFKRNEKAQKLAMDIANVTETIQKKANQYIASAEAVYADSTKAGGEKMNYVVNKLYSLVPDSMKSVFTRAMIEEIVQNSFDEMERYTELQLNAAIDKLAQHE